MGSRINRGWSFVSTLRSLAGHDLESRVPGQGRGIVVVFAALGNSEQALPYQGQEIMFNLGGITGSWKHRAAFSVRR